MSKTANGMGPAELQAYHEEVRRRTSHLFDSVAQLVIFDTAETSLDKQIVTCGTASLLRMPEREILVTCSHVLRALHEAKSKSKDTRLFLAGTRGAPALDITHHNVIGDGGRALDIVSIEGPSREEVGALNKEYFPVEMPLRRAVPGEYAMGFGFPTQLRQIQSEAQRIRPKRVRVGGRVSTLTDRDFWIIDTELNRVHLRAQGEGSVDSSELNFGGISGGAAFLLDEELFNPRLGGFVYEMTEGVHAHIAVVHANFLKADGTLDWNLIAWW